MMAVIWHL